MKPKQNQPSLFHEPVVDETLPFELDIYSVFETEHFKMVAEGKFEWVKGFAFYIGDMYGIDLSADSRFRAAKGMAIRKESKFLGLTYQKPPITFPLHLTNGKTIQKGHTLKYSEK